MDGKRSIQTIRLQNILSYGPDTPAFDLEPLNVLIGPNASGKSNLIEALSILAAAPKDIQVPLREGGGVGEWLWKGSQDPLRTATVEVTVEDFAWRPTSLRYRLSFGDLFSRFTLLDEVVEDEQHQRAGWHAEILLSVYLGRSAGHQGSTGRSRRSDI